jgi:hypothetical protein
MKIWNSTFNAQGSKVIIVVVKGAMKLYIAGVECVEKKIDMMNLIYHQNLWKN